MMQKRLSQALALIIVSGLVLLLLSHPISRLLAAEESARRVQERVDRLEGQVLRLSDSIPALRSVEGWVIEGDPSRLQARFEQEIRRSLAGLVSVQVSSSPAAEEDEYMTLTLEVRGRGDFLDIERTLSIWEQTDLPLQIRSLSLSAVGPRRLDDQIIMQAQLSVLVSSQ